MAGLQPGYFPQPLQETNSSETTS